MQFNNNNKTQFCLVFSTCWSVVRNRRKNTYTYEAQMKCRNMPDKTTVQTLFNITIVFPAGRGLNKTKCCLMYETIPTVIIPLWANPWEFDSNSDLAYVDALSLKIVG